MTMLHAVYAATASAIIAMAFYGILTVKHLVKLVVYFLLLTGGFMLYATTITGPTKLPYLVMVLSAIEEIIGLVLVIVYHKRHRTGLITLAKKR